MDKKSLETNERHQFFKKRLKEMGLYDKDSSYEGMLGTAVEELSATFGKQGHSGTSAMMTVAVFNQLMMEYQNPTNEQMRKFAEEQGQEVPEVFKEGQPEFNGGDTHE